MHLGSDGSSAVVEHYIDIPPSPHAHRVQVSSSPKKHVISVERYDLLETMAAHAEEDTTSITARLSALNLYARPNGLPPPASPARKRETSPSDVFATAVPTPSHFAHPEPVVDTQVVADGTPTDGTPVDEHDYIPVHLRWVGGRRDRASYAVPLYIRELYPADVTDRCGWKEQRYYVVVRGYETGIFFDFWCVHSS